MAKFLQYLSSSPYDEETYKNLANKKIFIGGYCPHCYANTKILSTTIVGISLWCMSCHKLIKLSDIKIIKEIQCPYLDCSAYFCDSKSLNQHVFDRHIVHLDKRERRRIKKCPYCKYKKKSLESIINHISIEHMDKLEEYQREYKRYKELKKRSCKKCNKDFDSFTSLVHHMASKKHKDDWKEYFNQDEVKKQLRKKKLVHNCETGQLINKKTLKEKKIIDNLIMEQKKILKEYTISCLYCNSEKFSSFTMLDKHIFKYHKDKWSKTSSKRCKICGLFIELSSYSKHHEICLSQQKIFSNEKTILMKEKVTVINTNKIICEYCKVSVNQKNYEKHLKKCPKNNNQMLEKKVVNSKEKPISKEKFWEENSSIKEI